MVMTKRIKLVIEYDGTQYAGWQVQPNAVTVQETIEGALKMLTRADIRIHGAGRTDAGVHALRQTAHFDTDASIPPENFAAALNTQLPPDIRIRSSEEVADTFHARFSAKGKTYQYAIYNFPVASAVKRLNTCHVREPLDVSAMQATARRFIGTHDFSAFCASNTDVEDKVRNVTRAEITADLPEILFTVSGNGFLYNMVRIMAGTLIEAGRHKISPEQTGEILAGKDRTKAPYTAPAHGLTLVSVLYDGVNGNAQ